MEIKVISGDITETKVDAVIVNLFEGVEHPGGATGAVDQALGGIIGQLIGEGEIKGKLNEITLIHTIGKMEAERVVVVGRMNLSIMAILDIIAWDDMICMAGLRYQCWLAQMNLLKWM